MEEQKKQSGFGIAGLVMGILSIVLSCAGIGIFPAILGLIFSIIGIASKNKKKGTSIAGLVCCIVGIIIGLFSLSLIGYILGEDTTDTDTATQAETQQENTLEATTEEVDDNIIDTDIGDCHIKYLKHEIVENMAGDKCVAIYYEFTNNSDENKAFNYVTGEKLFQNGVELETSLFHVNDTSKESGSEIKPGITITVCSGHVLRDETTDIEVEMGEWISFDDKPIDTMVLKLKSE